MENTGQRKPRISRSGKILNYTPTFGKCHLGLCQTLCKRSHSHSIKHTRKTISQARILPYKGRIVDCVLMRENTGQ